MLAEPLKRATLASKQTLNLVELLMPGNPGQDLHDQWKPYLRNSDLSLSARLTEFYNDRDRIRPAARDWHLRSKGMALPVSSANEMVETILAYLTCHRIDRSRKVGS